tara:strand:- start:880 stop:1095 length:216 start_codon:yes stop_codon:yes gene_type:complete
MGGPVRRIISAPKPAPAPAPAPMMTAPKGPTKAEAVQYDQSKRKGRRSTILTSTTGVSEELELAKKTLLGG